MESKSPDYPLVESVSFRWGVLENASYHQSRYERSLFELSKNRGVTTRPVSLPVVLLDAYNRWEEETQPDFTQALRPGQVKGRILYGLTLGPTDFALYQPPVYECAKIVKAPGLTYPLKWSNRSPLEELARTQEPGVYPLFEVDGLITDGLAANIVLKRKNQWVTPRHPLLPGTQREKLLGQGILELGDLRAHHIYDAGEVYLINALNRLGEFNLTAVSGFA